MTIELRVLLIVVSLLTLLFIAKKVRSSKVRLEDSIFWFCFAILILIVSVFPEIFYLLTRIVGMDAPVHLVFLFFIFVLLVYCFNLGMRVSQADTRIKELTQQLAVEKFERYKNDNEKLDKEENDS